MEAYGALLAGYARRRNTEAALSALQEFVERGGTPDAQMFDTVVDLCVCTGEFKRAMQVWSQAAESPFLELSPAFADLMVAVHARKLHTLMFVRISKIAVLLFFLVYCRLSNALDVHVRGTGVLKGSLV